MQRKKEGRRTQNGSAGFTLTELVVVMVVMVVLLALFIPKYVEYVNSAKAETILAQGRAVMMGAQSAAYEYYGKQEDIYSEYDEYGLKPDFIERVREISQDSGTILDLKIDATTREVTYLDYTDGTYEGIFENGGWKTQRYEPQNSEESIK